MEIPTPVRESYFRFTPTYESAGEACMPWTGPTRMPQREDGPRVPVIVNDLDVYDAAKIAFAVSREEGYPLAWYNMTCGNLWCVNPQHVSLVERSGPGRKTITLEQTTRYEDRYKFIRKLLSENPMTTQFEVMERLREVDLGGKAITISRIITRVRNELHLPGRVVRKRKSA